MNFFQRQREVRGSSRRLVVLFVLAVAAVVAVVALDRLGGPEKEDLVTVIGHDGVTTVPEIELLRTVCALLRCPLPPLADARPEQVTP